MNNLPGRWVYLYRLIDQFGQVIDVLVSEKRNLAATRQFFTQALEHGPTPTEVSTDRAPAYPRELDEVLPGACHVMEQYMKNPIKADHGRLKSRLRPMRGSNGYARPSDLRWTRIRSEPDTTSSLTPPTGSEADHDRVKSWLRPMRGLTASAARVITTVHALIQNLCHEHYKLGIEVPSTLQVVTCLHPAPFNRADRGHLARSPERIQAAPLRATEQHPRRLPWASTGVRRCRGGESILKCVPLNEKRLGHAVAF